MAETQITDEERLAQFSNGLDSKRPDGFTDEAWNEFKTSVVDFHKNEVQGLKINSAKMKEEKDKLSARISDYETNVQKLTSDNKNLSQQLEANQPEELKKVYENQQRQLQEMYSKKEADYTETIKKQSEYIQQLEKSDLAKDVLSEFNKYANKRNWLGGGRDIAQSFIAGESGEKFSRLKMTDGTTMLVNKESQSIEQALNAFCETEVGKSLLKSGSSGGGADGSTASANSGKKLTTAQYQALDPQAQMDAVLRGEY